MNDVKSFLAACSLTVVVLGLSSCSGGDEQMSAAVPTTALPSSTTATQTTAPTTTQTTPEPTPEATYSEEATYEAPVEYVEPYIVECQHGGGFGPIITSWSDGSETGWSEYCQSVHDEALQGEVEANTAVCETELCIYPNGASYPNPNYRIVATPSPWVQGQIDWQNCIDAGNTQDYCRATLN